MIHLSMLFCGQADAQPADTLPADTLPADTMPADALPADALPANALPADTLPADALPATSKAKSQHHFNGYALHPDTGEIMWDGTAEELNTASTLRVDLDKTFGLDNTGVCHCRSNQPTSPSGAFASGAFPSAPSPSVCAHTPSVRASRLEKVAQPIPFENFKAGLALVAESDKKTGKVVEGAASYPAVQRLLAFAAVYVPDQVAKKVAAAPSSRYSERLINAAKQAKEGLASFITPKASAAARAEAEAALERVTSLELKVNTVVLEQKRMQLDQRRVKQRAYNRF